MNTSSNTPAIYEESDVLEELQAALFDAIERDERGVLARAEFDARTGEFIITTNGGQRWWLSLEEGT